MNICALILNHSLLIIPLKMCIESFFLGTGVPSSFSKA